jgi:hypothetical protein
MVDSAQSAHGSPSRAALTGFVAGAGAPCMLLLAAFLLDARSATRSWSPLLLLLVGFCGCCGAAAGAACAVVAGRRYSARWLGVIAVCAMFAGALLGLNLSAWTAPVWHQWFSVGAGAVAGVLAVMLVVLREKRGPAPARDDQRAAS